MLKNLGFSELTHFVCDADWEIANENEDKWLFKREHQLATGDLYCDHTYLRVSNQTVHRIADKSGSR